ncbi:LysR family transcriptional regulator [Novosphingobium profundi]|uniref:LysR family transcriptional regulator n=1 Tax=Novosphingobium profundi TaxID=1774954 RepID=UPI001BD9363C|nr:LysR family transcriptional regulator [Novosphingobium profundi]
MTYFVKSVELGSFSAAGEAFGASSQLIGKHVLKLEQHLGVQLLVRTTRRQHLTDFGRTFYERAKIILAEVDIAESLAAETQQTPTGKLRINAPVSFGMYSLAHRLPEYIEAYPAVTVEMNLTNRTVDLVEEGYDVVFRVGELSDSRLMTRSLADYRFMVCASPAYLERHGPIAHPLDLQGHDCLCFSYTELRTHWAFDGPEGRVVVPVQSRFAVDHGEPILQAALAGLGVMLQPVELVEKHIAEGSLVRLLPNWEAPSRPMHLLYAPDRRLTPKLRSFLDFAIEAFA